MCPPWDPLFMPSWPFPKTPIAAFFSSSRPKVSHQRWRVGGWLPPEKIKSCYFENNIDCMVLKLTVYIRNVISFSYKLKSWRNANIYTFFREIFNFGLYVTENRLFWARPWLWCHCDVVLGMLVLILVCMERRDPQLYYGTNNMCLGVSFSSSQGAPLVLQN